jgi:hypothetical protein
MDARLGVREDGGIHTKLRGVAYFVYAGFIQGSAKKVPKFIRLRHFVPSVLQVNSQPAPVHSMIGGNID